MSRQVHGTLGGRWGGCVLVAMIGLLIVALGSVRVEAASYISAEPIPNQDIVGQDNLALLLAVGYPGLELWSQRLLNECRIVQNVVDSLATNGTTTTIRPGNTEIRVGAGGFQAVTNPSFILTLQDYGHDAANHDDIAALSNALGYVLNQGGTAHFNLDLAKAYDFALDYAVVSFTGTLTGVQAKAFFDHLGTIDPALWSGLFAGFTQIDLDGSPSNNSMVFLKPAATKQTLITGLSAAVSTTAGATYVTVNNNGQPSTDQAGVAFPGNDWVAFPNGDQYLAKLRNPSPRLLSELAAMRARHLKAVTSLLNAIRKQQVGVYLSKQFKCP
jgi:hypothetical protein